MKSPKTVRLERICPSPDLIMQPTPPPLVIIQEEQNNNDPVVQSSSPEIPTLGAPSAPVSSPQGVPPIPVAFSSPILTVGSKPSHKSPLQDGAKSSFQGVSITSESIPCDLSNQEDQTTPKRIEKPTSLANIKPEKKSLAEVSEGSQVARRLVFSKKQKIGKIRQSKTRRAGLVMSVARVMARFKAGRYSRRVGVTGGVYLAAVLEYLVAEVLELAGNCAR